MISENDPEVLVRILLIGLPYSGCKEVAKILESDYGCKIYDVGIQKKPENMQIVKYMRQICFQEFKQTKKAVMVVDYYHTTVFDDLKKRNYLNVVLVESSFKRRYENYLLKTQQKDSHQILLNFMKDEEIFQSQQYEKCQEYARVRLINNRSIDHLKDQIKQKKTQIMRDFRPNWPQYFMKIADIARRRSNCMKTSVGCVIVSEDQRVVSTGYNGTPRGLPSCFKNGCERCNLNESKALDQCLCLHAEQSAIIEVGITKTAGCTLYTTYYPCFSCAKSIKQANIKKIFYMDEYQKEDSGKPFIQQNFAPQNVIKIGVDNLYY